MPTFPVADWQRLSDSLIEITGKQQTLIAAIGKAITAVVDAFGRVVRVVRKDRRLWRELNRKATMAHHLADNERARNWSADHSEYAPNDQDWRADRRRWHRRHRWQRGKKCLRHGRTCESCRTNSAR